MYSPNFPFDFYDDTSFFNQPDFLNKPEVNDKFFAAIEKELPPVFCRQVASRTIGGLISPKTFSNLDALHQGPPVKMRMGTKVGYEKESFMRWLRERARS